MPSSIWSSNSVSVILLPSGDEGVQLLKLAKEWTSAWVLGPAFWILDTQIREIEGGVIPDVNAFFLGRDEMGAPSEREVSLFWALGAQEFSLIRLIAVRCKQSRAAQAITSEKVSLLAQALDLSRPDVSEKTHHGHLGTELKKINLIFSETKEKGTIPSSIVEPAWDANILASPEDRPTPGSFDAFVQQDEHYAGFVLANIASAAGIWSGLEKSTFEMAEIVPNRAQIRMQRVFIRAVATDKLSGDLARYALDQASSPDNEKVLGRISGKEVSALEKSLVPQKIHELVAHLMRGTGDENFIFSPWEDNLFRKDKNRSALEKIASRIADFVEGLKHIPKYLAFSINSSFDSEGDEIYSQEHLPLRLRAKFGPFTEDDIRFKDMPTVHPSSSRLWEHIRQTFSSSVDSPPNYPVPEPLNPKTKDRLVLGDMRNVAPDPDDIWEETDLSAAAGVQVDQVDWLDVEAHAAQKEILDQKKAELAPGIAEAKLELSESKELHRKSMEDEKEADIELMRAQDELEQDLDFASEIRDEHTHGLPPRIAGPERQPVFDDEQIYREQSDGQQDGNQDHDADVNKTESSSTSGEEKQDNDETTGDESE